MGDIRAAPVASPGPLTPFAALPPVMPVAGSSIAAALLPVDAGTLPEAAPMPGKDIAAHPTHPAHPAAAASAKP